MEENILESIKKMIGCESDYENFFNDPIVMCINSIFGILFQLGVGPKKRPFKLEDGSETWDEFIGKEYIDLVKNYMAIKVQKMFDPPSSSFLMSALDSMEKEYEWRLNVMAETP